MREMRATRGVGSGARTDVGRPALAGVLVEECDGWRGGIHDGGVSRVLWVSRRVTRSDTRGERYFPDTNDISGCPFVFSELPLWDQPRRDVPQRTTTTTSMCIVPTDTSDCTHVMHRSVSAAGNDGYASIGRGRDQTRAPAAWTRQRSSLNSIGTSNGATGGASGGRTHAPVTPAATRSRRRKRSTAAKSVDPPGTGRSRKKRRRSKPRKRSDAEEDPDCHRIGRLVNIAVDEWGEPLTAGHTKTNLRWEAGIITDVTLVNDRKLYFVYKGTFKCLYSASQKLEDNDREKIPNPHFTDCLDIKELEKLDLVEYLDLNIWPHPRDLDAAEEPEPRRPVPPESNGLDALAAIAVDTDTEEGRIAPRRTHRPERRHISFVVDEEEDATAELLGSELGSMDITEPPSPMPAALPRTEPDAAWTQAMHIANEIRGGSVSMDTLKEDIVQRHQETSSPAPPPTQSTPIVSIYPIDESPNNDEGPRSVTPARLRQDTPSTILGGMGRLTGGHDLFGNLPGGEFPMDDDEDEHGGEGEAAARETRREEEIPATGDEGPESDYEHVEPPRDDEANDGTEEERDGDGDGDEEEDADEEPGEDDEGAVAVLAGVMTPEADDAAALLAKAVGALIAKIESNTATRTSLVIRAEEIDAQNEELGKTIEVMTATIDTLRGRN